MENFNEVSLGFAEFVAQLLQETFDATLSAQNHQLEKYLELENALNLSPERFRELYLSDIALAEKERSLFGVELVAQMKLTNDEQARIRELVEDPTGIVHQGKLTNKGFDALKSLALENLVAERKNVVGALLNRLETARLIVDSGEIRAKLELSNLSQEVTGVEGEGISQEKVRASGPTGPVKEEVSRELPGGLTSVTVPRQGLQMKEIIDPATNRKTLIVDRTSLPEKMELNLAIPTVRVVARPLSASSSSNLFSEVVIKFKTA